MLTLTQNRSEKQFRNVTARKNRLKSLFNAIIPKFTWQIIKKSSHSPPSRGKRVKEPLFLGSKWHDYISFAAVRPNQPCRSALICL
jgi:hypothetical protein